MAIRFFKLPKNKEFNYVPRYYDEQKEELNERIKKIEQEMGVKSESKEAYVPNIKGQMRSYYNKNVKEKKQSNLRLILILIALFIIAYFLFFKSVL